MKHRSRGVVVLAAASALLTLVVGSAAFGSGVSPSSFNATMTSGSSTTVPKVVDTPAIPPNPDIVFLADVTSSMSGAIANVASEATNIMNTVLSSQSTAQFGVASYTDQACPDVFTLVQPITSNTATVAGALGGLTTANEGCNTDAAEDFLNGLFQVSTNPAVGFRTGSTRIVVLFGDSSSHDPSNGHTEAQTIAALNSAGIEVVAVKVPGTSGFLFDGLDSHGQATDVANATGGNVQNAGSASDIANEILAGLHNLPVTVTVSPTCDTGLTATYDATSKSGTSGDSIPFTETLTVAPDAPDGGTLHCTVDFLINGVHQDGFTQTVAIDVPLRPTDLALTKAASPSSLTEGNNTTLTLGVTNKGTDPDTNVTATDVLPAGMSFVSGDPGCTASAGTVTCAFGTVGAGATATKSFVVNVGIGAPSLITNIASVTGDRPEQNPADNTASAQVHVNHNPVCTALTAGPALWPPNHKLRLVTVSGATDPDGDPLTTTVTGVTQDEAINGLGDGDTGPTDATAAAASNQVWLRAERSGLGDGRVYGVHVTVTDGQGGSCTGTVSVGVPHDQSGSAAVDSGQSFTDF
ncbi:MAG TPA: VWA domain-containing protein [Gaiellaceae bacterium]|nr:VWA domain-containing protein [Gaiellaceae bacterium]